MACCIATAVLSTDAGGVMEDSRVNPYPPGSDEWHRYNLGIPVDVVCIIDTLESNNGGMMVKGWYFGKHKIGETVPLSKDGRYLYSGSKELM